jgi:hypothetical protein
MGDLARVLGADLAHSGAVRRLRAHRSALASAGLGEPAAHVDRVLVRLEAAIDGTDDARLLKLAALAHELDPPRVCISLIRVGVEPEVARVVEHVVTSFWAADLWRDGEAGPLAWLRRAGSAARPLLLFEIVHEGGATPSMAAAADLAGLGVEVASWRKRLLFSSD